MEIAVAAVIITLVFGLSLLSLLFSRKTTPPVVQEQAARPARPVVHSPSPSITLIPLRPVLVALQDAEDAFEITLPVLPRKSHQMTKK